MTEPAPGAGSDPSMLRTTAARCDEGWRLDGRKWFITGAEGAALAICMARTSQAIDRDQGATMFLVETSNPGFVIERVIDAMDRSFAGATPRSSSTTAACRRVPSSVRWDWATATPRCGWDRLG
jgi:acyl-CoA dehydrogenase